MRNINRCLVAFSAATFPSAPTWAKDGSLPGPAPKHEERRR